MIQGNFTFANEINSSDFGVFLHGGGTYSAPARKYEAISIPGRNGALTLDGGAWEDIEHSYYAFIPDNFGANVEGLRNALMRHNGMKRLTDTFHMGEFYLARYMRGLEPDVAPNGVAGEMTITFVRDPRRFLTSGEIAITNEFYADVYNFTIDNPTPYASRPLIRVYGEGTLGVNGEPVTINFAPNAYTAIDSELQEIYYETTNLGMFVELDEFPTLAPGTNTITVSGDIIRVTVVPRWFIL